MRHKLNSDKTPAELTPLPIVEGVDTIKKKSTLLQVIPSHKKPTYWYNVSGYRYNTTEMLPAGILLLWLSSHQINTLISFQIDKWCSCGLLATAEGQQLSLGRGWEGAQESQQVYRTGECAHANIGPWSLWFNRLMLLMSFGLGDIVQHSRTAPESSWIIVSPQQQGGLSTARNI